MKYLILLSLIVLTGCSTAPERVASNEECTTPGFAITFPATEAKWMLNCQNGVRTAHRLEVR